jgi:hypothetical protein
MSAWAAFARLPDVLLRAPKWYLSMPQIPADRLSFVVGVTGHRDVAKDDEPALRAAFGEILRQRASACPHTPLLVLSGLAAGADSLAAEEALARDVPVIACLPMPVQEYEKDFSQEELERFRALLERCARVVVTSQNREGGYVAAGGFIARYSHLLVAFWDRQTSRGAGGTADVVNMRITARAPRAELERLAYLPDVGPVDVIVTPRIGNARPPDAFSTKRLYPARFSHESSAERHFESILTRIDAYNSDLAVTRSRSAPGLQDVMERTDDAANRLQRRTNGFETTLYCLAFAAAAAQIVDHLPPVIKVACLALAFAAYLLARRNDYENRYQDYRALAEGLRVQNAWYCAGLTGHLVDAEYLHMQESELQWIRMALRYFYLLYCEERAYAEASHEHPVCQDWIGSQWRYYYRAQRRQVVVKHVLERVGFAAILLGVASTIASAVVLTANGILGCALSAGFCHQAMPIPRKTFDMLTQLLTEPLVLAAVLGALFAHISEKRNLAANARRYERMFRVFDRARADLRAIREGKPGDPSNVLYELGRAALAEHADWLIMKRDRPIKVIVL